MLIIPGRHCLMIQALGNLSVLPEFVRDILGLIVLGFSMIQMGTDHCFQVKWHIRGCVQENIN